MVGMYTIFSEGTELLASRRRTSNNVAIEGSTEEESNTGITRESTGVYFMVLHFLQYYISYPFVVQS